MPSVPTLRAAVATLGAGLVLALAGATPAAAASSCAYADERPDDRNRERVEMASVCMVNEIRAGRGLRVLGLERSLTGAAVFHSSDMNLFSYFAHLDLLGQDAGDRARAAGYGGDAGENLARNVASAREAVRMWMDSPSHRANVLDERYRAIGVGIAGDYWTHTFGMLDPPRGALTGLESAYRTGGAAALPAVSQPSKLQVLRAGVADGRLDVLAEITTRAEGDWVHVTFRANGARHTFTKQVRDGRLRFRQALPRNQRSARSGIVELTYSGNEVVRPTSVRLRAANGKASLRRSHLSLTDGVLRAKGTVSSRARGVARLSLSFQRADGSTGTWETNATIANGRWATSETLPVEAAAGGYLSIQFTGYLGERKRGEQIAKQVLAGQSF
ncbi:MAG TPA: CAP domain-containing protein [Solirubrobacteraceae bacterium]|nr:CAP domain-containing protein [Solirubrobacteraceae bacterium]